MILARLFASDKQAYRIHSIINPKIMQRNLRFLLVALCAMAFTSLMAGNFNFTQALSFAAPSSPNCYQTSNDGNNGNWTSTPVTIAVSHDISQTGSPFLVQQLNDNAWREMRYEIYHDDGTSLTLVKTVSKYTRYLLPAVSTHQLTQLDLDGVPAGNTQIHLTIRLSNNVNSIHTLNGDVSINGVSTCSEADVEANSLECYVGLVDCFNLEVCDVEYTVQKFLRLVPGLGGGYDTQYNFLAHVTSGGSGNFSFYWYFYDGTTWLNSTTNTFSFIYNGAAAPTVFLYIIDNVTGCSYYWVNTKGKQSLLPANQELLLDEFTIAPNPVAPGGDLQVQYGLQQGIPGEIAIYDLQGRPLQVLGNIEGTAPVGTLRARIDLAPGIYFIRIQSEHGVATRKFVVNQ